MTPYGGRTGRSGTGRFSGGVGDRRVRQPRRGRYTACGIFRHALLTPSAIASTGLYFALVLRRTGVTRIIWLQPPASVDAPRSAEPVIKKASDQRTSNAPGSSTTAATSAKKRDPCSRWSKDTTSVVTQRGLTWLPTTQGCLRKAPMHRMPASRGTTNRWTTRVGRRFCPPI